MSGRATPRGNSSLTAAQAIAAGEPWILVWTLQSTTPWRLLARASGIAEQRLDQIYLGACVSRRELAALAEAWKFDMHQIMLTLPEGTLEVT